MKPLGIEKLYYRQGPDHRKGLNTNFQQIKNTFGFKGITLGKWVNDNEKQLAANLIFDAFSDLALLLNVAPIVIGLRGNLSLAFGTGGRKGVQAHYNFASCTLHLAKNAGAGALAHEWWHAFDHYICPFLFASCSPLDFASSQWLNQPALTHHPLNQRLELFFQAIFLSDDLCQSSQYVKTAIEIDHTFQTNYFSQPEELTARAFESWLQNRTELKNEYLVSGTKKSKLALQGGYPLRVHQLKYGACLHDYFSLLGELLESKG